MPLAASVEGTRRYAERFSGRAAPGHFRPLPHASGLLVSSIGIGTYLGEPDSRTDEAYTEAVVAAALVGMNVVDTAINYRFQRSERSIGAALRKLTDQGYTREEFFLCTKAGYLTPDADAPSDPAGYFMDEYVKRGVFSSADIAAGCHCMTPRYLDDQLSRSQRNLGVDCIDLFYLHNPETQLGAVPRDEFLRRIHAAFDFLESAVTAGRIRAYGLATWNGFRQPENAPDFLSLPEFDAIATQIAGESHHFRFVQLPYNLAMTEALTRPNQILAGQQLPMVAAADALNISLIASASLLQGQLTRNLPSFISPVLGTEGDSQSALQFVRSTPGITTALVGMSKAAHVAVNARLVGIPPTPPDLWTKIFEQGASA